MNVGGSGVQAQEFSSALASSDPLTTPLLLPCRSVFLLDHIGTSGRGDHLSVVDGNQARDFQNYGSVAPELASRNDLCNVVFSQQLGQNSLRHLGVVMPLKEDIKHETVLVHRSPQPIVSPLHRYTDLVHEPQGTPAGFPVTKMFCEEGMKLDTPFEKGPVADPLGHAHTATSERPGHREKAVVQPHSVLDNAYQRPVAVGARLGH